MKSMRFFVVLFAVLMAGMACAQDKSWPWDFPQGVKIEAEPGQKVLSCESFYFDDLKKGDFLRLLGKDIAALSAFDAPDK